nr:hypothetical protein [Methyloceanibacter sp.]
NSNTDDDERFGLNDETENTNIQDEYLRYDHIEEDENEEDYSEYSDGDDIDDQNPEFEHNSLDESETDYSEDDISEDDIVNDIAVTYQGIHYPSYGYSIAIEPRESLGLTFKSVEQLRRLVEWLNKIRGIDLYIETSTESAANMLNDYFGERLENEARLNRAHVNWSERYGLQHCSPVRNDTKEYRYDIDYKCLYNRGQLDGLSVDLARAEVKGIRVATDSDGQRFYELIPNEKNSEIARAIDDYASEPSVKNQHDSDNYLTNDDDKKEESIDISSDDSRSFLMNVTEDDDLASSHSVPLTEEDRRKGVLDYINRNDPLKLVSAAELSRLLKVQNQYGGLLFVKMVRNEEKGDVIVPNIRIAWDSHGRPILRNASNKNDPIIEDVSDEDQMGDTDSNDDSFFDIRQNLIRQLQQNQGEDGVNEDRSESVTPSLTEESEPED